jgi:hypothetical protein
MADRARSFRAVARNDLFEEAATGKLYRVVDTGLGEVDTVLCDVRSSRTETFCLPTWELCRRAAPGYAGADRFVEVERKDDPYDAFRKIQCDADGHVWRSKENWRHIASLVEDPEFRNTLFYGPQRKAILERHATESKISLTTMRRLHRLYLQRGMSPAAMSSNLFRCGRKVQLTSFRGEKAPECRERTYANRPGRKPFHPDQNACPSALLRCLFEQYIDLYLTCREGPWQVDIPPELMEEIRRSKPEVKLYGARKRSRKADGGARPANARRKRSRSVGKVGNRKRITMGMCVDHLNYVCRCTRQVRDAAGQVVDLELAPFGEVTVRQFQHHYLANVPLPVRIRRRVGERQYALSYRPKRGHALQHSMGPGTQYLIDASVADVYVVSRLKRTVVVGRPTIYLCMDLYSRLIVGVHVTLEPPSFEGVALVLESIVTPKDELCARYGIAIARDQWPCEGLPGNGFLADHGSDYMKAAAWRAVNHQLRVPISNARAGDPTMRGLSERRFGSVPSQFQRAAFGVVEKDVATRCAPRYAWDAVHTVTEITKKMIRAILRHNDTPITHGGAIPDSAFDGDADTPINRWNWGIANLGGSLVSRSVDEVRLATWPHDVATPTDRGLLWNGAYYTSPFIESTLIHVWHKHGKDDVPIQYHPDSMSTLLLKGDDYLEYAVQYGTNAVSPDDASLKEWNQYRWRARRNNAEKRRAAQPQRIMDQLNNAEEGRKAWRERRKALGDAGRRHPETTDMRDARAAEVVLERESRGMGVFVAKSGVARAQEHRQDLPSSRPRKPVTGPGDARALMRRRTFDKL